MIAENELRSELSRLAPFHHAIDLPYGLSTHVPDAQRRDVERTRVPNLIAHAFPAIEAASGGSIEGRRVLDVACNCGGFSVEAARRGADQVLGFDIVPHYIEQANLIKSALELANVDFRVMAIDDLDRAVHGTFDIAFCFGILYHLENPVLAMKKIAALTTDVLVVDSNVIKTPFVHRPLWEMRAPRRSSAVSSDATTSLWRTEDVNIQFKPNAPAIEALLHQLGFGHIERIKPTVPDLEKRYRTGRRVTFVARRA